MVVRLRSDRLVNPLAVPSARPRLSWFVEGEAEAVRVEVDGRWDSGWIEGNPGHVDYAGEPVEPFGRATWRVTVRVPGGAEVVSEDAFWEAGPAEWTAPFIEGDRRGGPRSPAPSPRFAKTIRIDGDVKSARLAVTALGTHDTTIGGAAVSDECLAPGWTDYRHRLSYRVHDVTSLLKSGENEIASVVGDGWWCGHVEWRPREKYGVRPAFSAILHVKYADGRTEEIVTDESWTVAYGPILRADCIMGQIEDRRQDWTPGRLSTVAPPVAPTPAPHEPVLPTIELPALSIDVKREWPQDRYIVDFGQNLTGRVRIRLRGKKGDTVRLRYAEILTKNQTGDLYRDNLRTAEAIDHVTLGEDEEFFEPKHTFHGFRYMDVAGLATPLQKQDVVAVVHHSDYPWTGTWESDDDLLNKLWKNIGWGWRGNTVDLPTDCPQRDERLGWTGDAQVFAETSMYLSDAGAFWRKYVRDLIDSQLPDGGIPSVAPQADVVGTDGGPAWSDVIIVAPWTVWTMTGDDAILREAWPTMVRFMEFLQNTSVDGIRKGIPGQHQGYGDWLSVNAETPLELMGTAFWAYDAKLMAECARHLGEDAGRWESTADSVTKAFRRRYVTEDGLVGSGSQTSYLLPLRFGLLEERHIPIAVQAMVDDMGKRGWKLSAGFVGSPYLCRVLEEGGRLDVAYKLLHQKGWPSFLYAVTQGATTIWEHWDGWTEEKGFQGPGMNSFNHYAYGAVGAWMMDTVAGIRLGFDGFTIRPRPGGELGRVSATVDGPRGRVTSSWERVGEGYAYRIEVGPGVRARVELPGREPSEVGPGVHEFR